MSGWKCEACGAIPPAGSFELHDYCAVCGKNKCEKCAAKGCCGNVPMRSGMEDDDEFGEQHKDQQEG